MTAPTLKLSPLTASSLSEKDQVLLKELEAEVESAFYNAALALAKIEDYESGRLWKNEHASFNEYLQARFGYGRQHAGRQMDAGRFLLKLENSGGQAALPLRESQLRPVLQKLPESSQLPCWEEISKKHGKQVGKDRIIDIPAQVIEREVDKYKKKVPKEALNALRKPRVPNPVKTNAALKSLMKTIDLVKKVQAEPTEITKVSDHLEKAQKLLTAAIKKGTDT